jgi:O-succinylbenzoic acid--CoA ligase
MRNSYIVNQEEFSEEKILNDKNLSSYEVYLQDAFQFIQEWYNKKETVLGQTSGSTGLPKKMELSKKDMLNSAKATGQFFSFNETAVHFCPLPASFIAGKMMIVRSIEWNTSLHLLPPSSNPLEHCTQKFDFGVMTPHQLQVGLSSASKDNIKNIKTLLLGGSPISKKLEDKIQDLETEIYIGYGMTETMSHVSLRKLNGKGKSSAYKAVEGIHFTTDDRDCLCIHANHLSFKKLITNDIVHLINSTSFEWKGRYDFVINSGGIKLFPEQIEKKLAHVISNHFYITSEAHEILGEQVILKIEGDKIEGIEELIRPLISKFEFPKKIYFVEKFDRTGSGKIIRK